MGAAGVEVYVCDRKDFPAVWKQCSNLTSYGAFHFLCDSWLSLLPGKSLQTKIGFVSFHGTNLLVVNVPD